MCDPKVLRQGVNPFDIHVRNYLTELIANKFFFITLSVWALTQCIKVICLPNNNKQGENPEVTDANQITMNAMPNPFDNSTTLVFTPNYDSKVKVDVYNVTGVKVASLFNEDVKANETKSVLFDGHNLPNGVYIYAITSNEKTYYYKLLLVR